MVSQACDKGMADHTASTCSTIRYGVSTPGDMHGRYQINIGGLAGLCVESRSLRTMIKVTISTSHNSLSSAHVALWLLSSGSSLKMLAICRALVIYL